MREDDLDAVLRAIRPEVEVSDERVQRLMTETLMALPVQPPRVLSLSERLRRWLAGSIELPGLRELALPAVAAAAVAVLAGAGVSSLLEMSDQVAATTVLMASSTLQQTGL